MDRIRESSPGNSGRRRQKAVTVMIFWILLPNLQSRGLCQRAILRLHPCSGQRNSAGLQPSPAFLFHLRGKMYVCIHNIGGRLGCCTWVGKGPEAAGRRSFTSRRGTATLVKATPLRWAVGPQKDWDLIGRLGNAFPPPCSTTTTSIRPQDK